MTPAPPPLFVDGQRLRVSAVSLPDTLPSDSGDEAGPQRPQRSVHARGVRARVAHACVLFWGVRTQLTVAVTLLPTVADGVSSALGEGSEDVFVSVDAVAAGVVTRMWSSPAQTARTRGERATYGTRPPWRAVPVRDTTLRWVCSGICRRPRRAGSGGRRPTVCTHSHR